MLEEHCNVLELVVFMDVRGVASHSRRDEVVAGGAGQCEVKLVKG